MQLSALNARVAKVDGYASCPQAAQLFQEWTSDTSLGNQESLARGGDWYKCKAEESFFTFKITGLKNHISLCLLRPIIAIYSEKNPPVRI